MKRTKVLTLFILSGAAGLVYEACWSRQLGVILGFTEKAMITSVAAFFMGCAFGAWGIAKRASEITNPLKAFGIAEVVAGVWAFGIPSLLEGLASFELMGREGGTGLALAQFLCVALVLLPTTAALGASLPLMAEFLGREEGGERLLPRAYGLHLWGALSGLFGASFFGFLIVGVNATHHVGSGLSMIVGISAFLVSRHDHRDEDKLDKPTRVRDEALPLVPYLIAALSGFSALALQGLYFRAFSRTLQNSTYTFAAVLSVFLLSLAMGSSRAGKMVRSMSPMKVVGVSSLIAAVLVPASLLLFTGVTHLGQLDPGEGFFKYIAITFGLAAIVVAPAASCMGAVLPALWIHMESRGLGFAVGRLAALNTLAAALGAFAVGFVFLPDMGLWGTARVISGVSWLVAALVVREIWTRPAKNFALISIALVLVTALGAGSPTTRLRPGEELKASWETAYGLLEVVQGDSNLMMRQNIHYVMGDTRSTQAEINQATLPLLLHPNPRELAFLGLATGITAGGALAHPEVEKVTAIEIIPEVRKALRHFESQNRFFLDDPRTEIVFEDAFHYFGKLSPERFDLVISDLFVPWQSQTGYLYSVEHFENVRASLKPQGIFGLWISLREVGALEFRLIADSLSAVFPHVSIWREQVHPRKICLVGSAEPIVINVGEAEKRMISAAPGAAKIGGAFLAWEDLEASYLGEWPVRSGALLNTVDQPRVEHRAPITERSSERHGQDWLDSLSLELFATLKRRDIGR